MPLSADATSPTCPLSCETCEKSQRLDALQARLNALEKAYEALQKENRHQYADLTSFRYLIGESCSAVARGEEE